MAWPEVVKDVILTACAVAGAVVAIMGLRTWRLQLHGTADFDLARRLLRALLEWRDAIDLARVPALWGNEMAGDEKAATEAEEFQAGVRRAYERRWDRVVKARREIDVLALEAEALWGEDHGVDRKALNAITFALGDAIREHIENQGRRTPLARGELEQRQASGRVLYASRPVDEYGDRVAEVRAAIETSLRARLRRR